MITILNTCMLSVMYCLFVYHILETFSDVNHQVTKTLLSPLMTAVMGKNTQCLSVLWELGARLDLQDQHGDTAYHHAVKHHPDAIPVSIHYKL